MPLPLADRLAALLRPPGGGVHLVSTGREAKEALVRRLAGAATTAEAEARWRGRSHAVSNR